MLAAPLLFFTLDIDALGCDNTLAYERGKMATIADELLNDFEDSGSEDGDAQNDDFAGDGASGEKAAFHTGKQSNGAMELEDDEEAPQDADGEGPAPSHLRMEEAEDEEETKARVEKMELKAVSDVRSVAGLMKQLEPVMEVSLPHTHP